MQEKLPELLETGRIRKDQIPKAIELIDETFNKVKDVRVGMKRPKEIEDEMTMAAAAKRGIPQGEVTAKRVLDITPMI